MAPAKPVAHHIQRQADGDEIRHQGPDHDLRDDKEIGRLAGTLFDRIQKTHGASQKGRTGEAPQKIFAGIMPLSRPGP
jgi:hypothetical protein